MDTNDDILTFDAETHSYMLRGRKVPSVTDIISVIPQWKPDEWYLTRGTANHACYAMVAKGQQFEPSPVSEPFVVGCRKFFADIKPRVIAVEKMVYSTRYQFAGTVDMLCEINGKRMILDWKTTATEAVKYQLTGYAIALHETCDVHYRYGLAVEIRPDGTYRMGRIVDCNKQANRFLALRSVKGIMDEVAA